MKTVLIVDDMEVNRRVMCAMLHNEYRLIEASNGMEAMQLLEQYEQSISAVLLDISMPLLNGYGVLQRMRESVTLMHIPVIMLTGSETEDARVTSLSLGANDFIMKPYKPEIIKHCLQTNIALHESATAVRASQRDKLTGLYNREPFFDAAQELIEAHEPGYYIMARFDIDKFRVINDQYGMEKGDEVLRHIGKVFKEGFTPHGGICCRISADDFAVLYPSSFRDTDELAEIRRAACHIDGLAAPIIFSIGRYVVEDLSLSPVAMYDRAGLAADSVKERYDDKIAVYDESMRARLLKEREIVLDMETALQQGQFEVWFQPQYNHSTGAMIGAEALVRWRHPIKGLIPPNDFIPLFEKNGFIYALDKYVWSEVCRYLKKWREEGRSPLPVSVNISRYDIFCPDVVQVFKGLVETYGIPVELLRLEVTESAFASAVKHMLEVIKELIEYGFVLEIDDFGSGYSSLNTLKDVPAQVIKLDMRFLQSSDDTQRGGNIVESVVRMAKWLGMSVIAEGVETRAQADYLRSVGCSYIQGYFYSRPMPAGDYEQHCCNAQKEQNLLAMETVENLNNNSFWDPNSMDTLIFNSYVGAACIYEYYNGRIELLRATEKYAQVMGSAGMTVEDALKLNWEEHLSKETMERIIADLKKSAEGKKEVCGEYVFLNLPGCPSETYLRSTMRIIASSGDRYLVYCTNENITEQRCAEKRERLVAEETRLIIENVNCGIYATESIPGGGFRVIFANERFYSMHGYTKQQMQTELKNEIEIVHPEDRDMVMQTVGRLLREKGNATYEYRCLKRDGSPMSVSCNSTVTSFTGSDKLVFLAVIYDVTAKKSAEQQIQMLSERFQTILDKVDLGIIGAVVKNEKAKYVFANDRYYSMLGYTAEQFEAEVHTPYQTVALQDRQKVIEQTEKLNENGEAIIIEYHAVTRSGELRLFRSAISLSSLIGFAEPVQFSVLRDITEEKQASD